METDTIAQSDGLKILVLEDSARDFELINEQLNDAGFTLKMSWVETEDLFISALHENQYDIIMSDFTLPGFDAFGALRISKEICPEVPFICVSGSIGEETAIELLKLGAVDYVLKDRPERLPFAVKRAIDEAREKKLRKKAQEELLFNYALFRIAGSTAKLGGWRVDLDTNIATWSEVVAD
ncbi:MAG: response regulator, partial [Proteobacteria bacterium]|nr:response regulator [Pseudomonadota bacterium]